MAEIKTNENISGALDQEQMYFMHFFFTFDVAKSQRTISDPTVKT